MIVSDKVSFGKKCFKSFIGHQDLHNSSENECLQKRF